MKKWLKIVGYVVGIIIVIVVGLITYINLAFPKVSPPQTITVHATPELIARGKYLANHVVGCVECHSGRDWNKFAGPIIPGTEGKGGEKFDHETAGFPGEIYSRNITPYNLKNWTDGEIYRMITVGVRKNGEPVFPLMPYQAYAHMDPEDVNAVIAYLRTLPAIESNFPDAKLDFPLNIIERLIPKDVQTPGERPDPEDTLKYGEYLVTIGACNDCHTPRAGADYQMDKYLSGGNEFMSPATGDIVRSANITQDAETGIGLWTEDVFLDKFRTYRDSSWSNKPVKAGEFNTAMPWLSLSGMTDGDLRAIYKYLKTVPPVTHKVEKFTPAHKM